MVMLLKMDDIFFKELPNHELYGYGELLVGDICEVDFEQGLDHLITKGEVQMLEYLDSRNRKQKKYKKI